MWIPRDFKAASPHTQWWSAFLRDAARESADKSRRLTECSDGESNAKMRSNIIGVINRETLHAGYIESCRDRILGNKTRSGFLPARNFSPSEWLFALWVHRLTKSGLRYVTVSLHDRCNVFRCLCRAKDVNCNITLPVRGKQKIIFVINWDCLGWHTGCSNKTLRISHIFFFNCTAYMHSINYRRHDA